MTPAELRALGAALRDLHAQQQPETTHDLVRHALASWMQARSEALIAAIEYMKDAHERQPD